MNKEAFLAGYFDKQAGLREIWGYATSPVKSLRKDLDVEGQIHRGITGAVDESSETALAKAKPYLYAAGGTALAMPLIMLAINRHGNKKMEGKLDTLTELQRKELELARQRLGVTR